MPLPPRPSTYIMTLLLLVLVGLAAYIAMTVTSPDFQEAVQRAKHRREAPAESAH